MTAGRPPYFKTVEELDKLIDDYFQKCQPELLKDSEGNVMTDKKGNALWELNPPTITGLALHLGFVSRQSIYDYEKRNDEFSYSIKKARTFCEHYAEKALLTGGIAPAGPIFILKNYGWRDNYHLESETFNTFAEWVKSLKDDTDRE